jgi:hypothetical protein
MLRLPFVLGIVLAGCGPKAASGPCNTLCAELVGTCDVAAFPDETSCLEGCLYDQDQGADVDGELTCVQAASCDLFAIVECEHQYGLE